MSSAGGHRLRGLLRIGVAALLVSVVVLVWFRSRLPAVYSVHHMGYTDFGGGTPFPHEHPDPDGVAGSAGHHQVAHHRPAAGVLPGTSVNELVADPGQAADVRVELVARQESTRLADGTPFAGFTVNGTTPGPILEAEQGQLVEVLFRNENVSDGATLHWHGIDVPNGVDGVAGVTQDAVPAGGRHLYRFVAEQPGTYWYHSHQVSHVQVLRGLLGPVVIHPRPATGVPGQRVVRGADGPVGREVTALLHSYDGRRTINGRSGDVPVAVPPGTAVRVRVVNTDNGPTSVWVAGASFQALAVDGRDLHQPGEVTGRRMSLTAGARVDLGVTVPLNGRGVRVQVPGGSLLLGPAGASAETVAVPAHSLDLLSYGVARPVGFDPSSADRRFDYVIGRRFGLLDGRPGMWWTINGHLYPDVPMFMVSRGDVVVMSIRNDSGDVHPMHLHGHHAVVLAVDGRRSTGSPWWVDSVNVENGQSVELAFLADNPGIWMDHCHNLPHATEGLVAHLMYQGVSTPYLVGSRTPNRPE